MKNIEEPKLTREQGIEMYRDIKRARNRRENIESEIFHETLTGNLQILGTLESTLANQDRCIRKLRDTLEANFTQDELVQIYWIT